MKLKFYIDIESWHSENNLPTPLTMPTWKSSTSKRYEITADIPESFKRVDVKVEGGVREVEGEMPI